MAARLLRNQDQDQREHGSIVVRPRMFAGMAHLHIALSLAVL